MVGGSNIEVDLPYRCDESCFTEFNTKMMVIRAHDTRGGSHRLAGNAKSRCASCACAMPAMKASKREVSFLQPCELFNSR